MTFAQQWIGVILAVGLGTCLVSAQTPEPVVWWDGSTASAPRGKLLSDNAGYWGDHLLTGVTYEYPREPDNPRDQLGGAAGTFGRRLLDGRIRGDWHVPVGRSQGPVVVVFDFKRPCDFSEVTLIASRTPLFALSADVADDPQGPWREVHRESLDQAQPGPIRRLCWGEAVAGRYLRLAIESSGVTYVDEVLVWGEGEVSETFPEHIAATHIVHLPAGQWESIAGITATRFDAMQFNRWQRSLGQVGKQPAVWAAAPGPNPASAILPDAAARRVGARLQMARNETESRYVTLTNTSLQASRRLKVRDVHWYAEDSQTPQAAIRTSLRVGGALPTTPPRQRLSAEQRLRLHQDATLGEEVVFPGNVQILPFFAAGEQLGSSLMRRYLTNGATIEAFPDLALTPGAAAMVMLQVTTDQAPPGRYHSELVAEAEDGTRVVIPLELRVADVVLPELTLWIRSWGNGTDQFPFESLERRENDVRVNRALGATVWPGFPVAGSKAERFSQLGPTYHRLQGLPDRLVHAGYSSHLQVADLTEADRGEVVTHIQGLVSAAQALNLTYDQWWVELWDEPQEANAALFGVLAGWIRQTDPQIRIYMNPLFWRPNHAPPEVVVENLGGYYNDRVDISVPIATLVLDEAISTQTLWQAPRFVNALFMHPASRAGRGIAWRAYELGFNGWGYYCYYAPRGDPWDIRTWSELDYRYQMVFPGPRGPIITPLYETMRDGWEDYRLLKALEAAGEGHLQRRLITAYRQGAALDELRERALRAF